MHRPRHPGPVAGHGGGSSEVLPPVPIENKIGKSAIGGLHGADECQQPHSCVARPWQAVAPPEPGVQDNGPGSVVDAGDAFETLFGGRPIVHFDASRLSVDRDGDGTVPERRYWPGQSPDLANQRGGSRRVSRVNGRKRSTTGTPAGAGPAPAVRSLGNCCHRRPVTGCVTRVL